MKTVEFNKERKNNVYVQCGLPDQQGDNLHPPVLAQITKEHIFENVGTGASIEKLIQYSRKITGVPETDPYTEHEVLSVLFGWLVGKSTESVENEIKSMMQSLTQGIPADLMGLFGLGLKQGR